MTALAGVPARIRRAATRDRSGLALLFAGCCLAASCRISRTYIPDPSVYDRASEAVEDALRTPRVLCDAGRLAEAYEALQPLARSEPRNLRIATFLQELELALLERGASVRGIPAPTVGEAPGPAERLFPVYLRRAEEVPTSEGYVLAARLAPDPERGRALLQEALRIDPANPWAHYAEAWSLARAERFDEAREALERALRIDPGHLPSVRLDGALEARAGKTRRALLALENWLERSVEDPTVDPGQRATVRLDLAILHVLDGHPARALALLEGIEPRQAARRAQVELVRAAAFQALDEPDEALRSARRAREVSEDELFALVDEALLAAERGDPEAERAMWAAALEVVERGRGGAPGDPQPADFRTLLIRLQALTRLARLGGAGAP